MIAYTVLVSFGMRTVSFLERLFSPGIGSYAANLTEVKTRMPNAKVLSEKQAIVASLTEKLQGAINALRGRGEQMEMDLENQEIGGDAL